MTLADRTGPDERARSRSTWSIWRLLAGDRDRNDQLVSRIRERASATRREPGTSGWRAFEPASAAAIAEAEASLDFALPGILKRLLLEVGNGGFGPGQGLLGVRGGATDEHGNSLVDLYDGFSATNPDDPEWKWPERLIPLCSWGDSTYSCVDCAITGGRLVTYDANGYRPGSDLAELLAPQDLALDAWLRLWADGVDLWSRMFPLD